MDLPARQVWAKRAPDARFTLALSQASIVLTLSEIILSQIEFRTFSNIWYWLAVAVTWASVSHWIIGIPFDMIYAARRHGGQAAQDLDRMAAINVRRLMQLAGTPGLVLTGMAAFFIASAAMLGFFYGLEFAQGLMCLACPLVLVGGLTWRLCRRLDTTPLTGAPLVKALLSLRFWIQVIAMAAIFCTAILGMFVNLSRMSLF